MKSRWKLDDIDANLLLATATALDPRFKHLKFLTEVEQPKVKEYIIERAKYIDLMHVTSSIASGQHVSWIRHFEWSGGGKN